MKRTGKILIIDDDEITCFIQKECPESMEVAHENGYDFLDSLVRIFLISLSPRVKI